MADYRYAYNGPTDGTARALLRDAEISTKIAINLANFIRGRSTAQAKHVLGEVMAKRLAVPFKRFNDGVGHRKGPLGAGRYPLKASAAFLQLIATAEANALQAGLSSDLVIIHLAAQKASSPFHFGRLRRRQMKKTHVEIVVKESEEKKKKKPSVKDSEAKPVAKVKPSKPAPKKESKAEADKKESNNKDVAEKKKKDDVPVKAPAPSPSTPLQKTSVKKQEEKKKEEKPAVKPASLGTKKTDDTK